MNKQNNQPSYPRKVRNKWYFLVDHAGKTVKEVCEMYFISRKTYYKWRKKDRKGNHQHREKKGHPNTKLTKEIKLEIEKTKRKFNYGPLKMKMHIKRVFDIDVSTTIIYRYYKRKRLIKRPQRSQPWYEPLKKRLNVTSPGMGVQMDIKYVYEKGIRMYQFSVLDPYTQKYYFKIFPNKKSRNEILTLFEAQKYFGFEILSVQTDNGSEFRGDFHLKLTEVNIPHYFIPKKSPWWNGKVERIHRTIDEEYYHNPDRAWDNVNEWLYSYNHERIHLSLNGLTPQEKLLSSSVTSRC